jgi:hypothetical protein
MTVDQWFRAVALLCLSALPVVAAAQQGVTQASLAGSVEDPSAGRVEGAVVEARSLERGQSWSATTDAEGRYRFLYLPVDTYEVRAAHPSFRPATQRLALTLGQAMVVRFRLQLAGTAERVEVEAEAPIVEVARTQVAETIVAREINRRSHY